MFVPQQRIYTYRNFPRREGLTMEQSLAGPGKGMTADIGVQVPGALITDCIRLCCSLCLLENDPSVIEPDVLSKDRARYEGSGDQKYVDKAHRRGKIGWNVGRHSVVHREMVEKGRAGLGRRQGAMKVGDWVFFRARNGPSDVRVINFEANGGTADVTGEALYSGRGRIVGIAGGNYTVREETTDRLVEVGPHPEDRISPLASDYATLTIGYLRAFLEQHKEAPDDIPVIIPLPLSFFSDLEDMPPDHPEYKAVSECQSVEACGIGFVGCTEDGEVTDEYIPREAREGKNWDFTLEIIPNAEQCFDALREREDE